MHTVTSIDELRRTLDGYRASGNSVGLVPTMGYLHDGHLSLIRAARSECDIVVTTLFVNPLQFAQNEDLGSYPRDEHGDATKAESAGSDYLFMPGMDQMYPNGPDSVLTIVAVPPLASVMEGSTRPLHFAGVCTVVTKIFNIVGECSAYFGEKDYQQLAIITQMASDLSAPVRVVGCATLRDDDGLAMSSRNVYLSAPERSAAPILYLALCAGRDMIQAGCGGRGEVVERMAEIIDSEPLAELDYLEIADPVTLAPADHFDTDVRIFGAIRFSKARLIDNISARANRPRATAESARG